MADPTKKGVAFTELADEAQQAIRLAQTRRKEAKLRVRTEARLNRLKEVNAAGTGGPSRCTVTSNEYFEACPHGRFRDANLAPTVESLELLLRVLSGDDEHAQDLNKCNYFQFSGPAKALWNPRFNARLAWEGFFTITARTGPNRRVEPLPELQPYYGVLLWRNFEQSGHVKKMLKRLTREQRGYRLSDRIDPERTWSAIEKYHHEQVRHTPCCRPASDSVKQADAA